MACSLPSKIDHEFMSGTDITLEFVMENDAGPIDITNDQVVLRVQEVDAINAVRLEIVNDVGDHYAPNTGRTRFALSPDDVRTNSLKLEEWPYEVWRIPGGGGERLHIHGVFRIYPVLRG